MNDTKTILALAKAISAVAHPLLMPAFSLVMLYVFDGFLVHRPALFAYLMVVLLINSGAPAISLAMLKRRGYISDANISRREERIWPFLLVLAYQLAAWFLVHTQSQLEVPLFYQNMLLGLVVSIGCAWLVTLQFKVSMHMLAQGGVMAIYSHVVWRTGMFDDGWVATLVVLSGLVGWSRLTLNAHTQKELYAGYALGYACVWLSLF